ncbi:MAG TPA: hypothetical protein VMH77_01480, partial [Steroidobacteraceae bacterium]|nr:hypothetical protein [Steroidobacteraceae bacterium]
LAELHIAEGDLPLAVTQLQLALSTPGLSDVQRKRFLARQKEVQGALQEQYGNRARSQQPSGG